MARNTAVTQVPPQPSGGDPPHMMAYANTAESRSERQAPIAARNAPVTAVTPSPARFGAADESPEISGAGRGISP